MQMLMALNGVLEVRKRSIKCQFDELLDTGTVLVDRIVHLVDWFSESVNSMELVCLNVWAEARTRQLFGLSSAERGRFLCAHLLSVLKKLA